MRNNLFSSSDFDMCFGLWVKVLMGELLWLMLDGNELVQYQVGHIEFVKWKKYMDIA